MKPGTVVFTKGGLILERLPTYVAFLKEVLHMRVSPGREAHPIIFVLGIVNANYPEQEDEFYVLS